MIDWIVAEKLAAYIAGHGDGDATAREPERRSPPKPSDA